MKPKEVKAEATKLLNEQGITEIDPAILKLALDKARRMSRQYYGCVDWNEFFGEFGDYIPTFYEESRQGIENTTLRENAAYIRKLAAQR